MTLNLFVVVLDSEYLADFELITSDSKETASRYFENILFPIKYPFTKLEKLEKQEYLMVSDTYGLHSFKIVSYCEFENMNL